MLNKIESFKENGFWIKKNFSENVKYKVLEDVNHDDYGIKSLLISKI